jgi:hypothetical protein
MTNVVRSRQKHVLALASLCVQSLASLSLFDSYYSPPLGGLPHLLLNQRMLHHSISLALWLAIIHTL